MKGPRTPVRFGIATNKSLKKNSTNLYSYWGWRRSLHLDPDLLKA
jgi:hypothetical protein